MKKKVVAMMLAVGMLLTGCGTNSAKGDSIVFTVEKDNETVAEVSAAYAWLDTLYLKDTYESFFGSDFWEETDEDGVTYAEYFKEELLQDLEMRKVVVLEAEAAGITLSEEEKEICRENAESYLDSITEETIELTGITVDTLAEYEMDYAIYEKYETALIAESDVVIDEEALRQSEFFVLQFSTVEYTDEGDVEEYDDVEKAQVKKEADAAYEMLQSGKTMEEVAEANDMDPEECMWIMGKTAEEDQDEYYDEAFETAAFSLEEGEYSEVVEGIDGYYIIQMTSLNNEEETEAAIESAQEEAASEFFYAKIEEAMEDYDITVNETIWAKIDLTADIAFEEEAYYEDEEYDEEEDSLEYEIEGDEDIETEG